MTDNTMNAGSTEMANAPMTVTELVEAAVNHLTRHLAPTTKLYELLDKNYGTPVMINPVNIAFTTEPDEDSVLIQMVNGAAINTTKQEFMAMMMYSGMEYHRVNQSKSDAGDLKPEEEKDVAVIEEAADAAE